MRDCRRPGARLIAFAQDPAFEVASIRPNVNGQGSMNGRVAAAQGKFEAKHAPTRLLIRYAYGVKDYQLSGGPTWLDSEYFEVEAKAADSGADNDQLRAMLRTLLAERFKLVVRREAREMSVYHLLAGKNGVKFPEIKPGDPRRTPAALKPGAVGTMYAASIPALADMLSSPSLLGRPVLDKTGLTGDYFIDTQFGPDEDMLTIVQDQGLKVESAKAPIEMIVIDHIERPDAN